MLTDEQVEAYRRDGALVIKGAVQGEELRRLQAAADRLTEEAVGYGRELDARAPVELLDDHGFREWHELDDRRLLFGRGPDGSRVWRRAEGMWDREEIYRITSAHPGILGAVRAVVGEDVVPVNSAMVVKMPGAGATVPWHRDPPGEIALAAGEDTAPDFVVDVYLDRSTVDNGCVWVLPGSHRWPEPAEDAVDFDVPGAVPLEAEPGDVLLHCTGVLHGSPRNESVSMRRTLYLYYGPPSWFERFASLAPAQNADEMSALLDAMVAERAASGLDAARAGA